MLKREIRVSVHGTYQFTAKVSQDEKIADAIKRIAVTMKVDHLTPHVTLGQVNFV